MVAWRGSICRQWSKTIGGVIEYLTHPHPHAGGTYQWRKAFRLNIMSNCAPIRFHVSCGMGVVEASARQQTHDRRPIRFGVSHTHHIHARHTSHTPNNIQRSVYHPIIHPTADTSDVSKQAVIRHSSKDARTWMAVELPTKVSAILRPLGGISHMEALMPLGIHSTNELWWVCFSGGDD